MTCDKKEENVIMNKGETMANVEIKILENLKNEFEKVCHSLGMTRDEAFEIFARAVVDEGAMPFEVKASDALLLGPYNSFDEIIKEADQEIEKENKL